MPSQLVKATAGASALPPKGLPPAPPGMMWQETNQQIPTGLMKLTSPGEYGAALRDMNAEWLLKVLQGAPGSVSAGEKALIDKLRAQYTTASGELKLPPDIMDQLRAATGAQGTPVQMEGWQPKGGYSGPSTTTTLNDPRMDKSVPYSEPTAASIKSPNSYFKAPTPTPAATPAGNNLTSGIVTPQTDTTPVTQSGTPNTGTLGTDINQSPFSPTAGTRKRTSPNKYFNQRWFGTKKLA